ncbi:MAG: DMT family transporter [Desulfobacteraceae bacterium]|nr:DMT family transporter [Desulfobacteraceae bacterium]
MIQVLCGAFLISFSSIFVKLVHVGPTAALFYRFLFGGLALLMVTMMKGAPLWQGRRPMFLAVAGGVVFSLDLFFWHRSIHYIGPGLATLLGNFQVFFLAAVGVIFQKERLTLRFIIATLSAFAGFLLMVGFDFASMPPLYRLGIIYGLLTAISYAALTLIFQKSQLIFPRLSPGANMAWVCAVGAIAGAMEILPSGENFTIPDLESLIFLIAYGIICSAIGWSLISRGLPKVSASLAGLALILQPIGHKCLIDVIKSN